MKSIALILIALSIFIRPVSGQTGGRVEEYFAVDNVSNILPVASGIWAVSGGLLTYWNTADGSHRIYTTRDGLPSGNCSTILETNDGVWAVFDNRHIVRFNGSSWEPVQDCPANGIYIRSFLAGPDGEAIFWTSEGIYRQVEDEWLLHSLEGCVQAPYWMFVAPNGDIWMTSLTWCIDNCPTSGNGAARFDGESWTVFDTGSGLLDKRTVEIDFDAEGRVYVLSMGGVSVFDGTSWTRDDTFSAGSSRNMPYNKMAVLTDGTVWLTNGYATYRRRNGKWSIYTAEDMHITGEIATIYADSRDRIWVGTYEGVSMFDGSGWAVKADERVWGARMFNPILQGQDGRVWAASSYGLFSWNDQQWNVFRTGGPPQTPEHAAVSPVSGDIWFESGVLSRYSNGTWRNFTLEDGLPSNWLYCLDVDDEGNVWVGTYAGLAMYDGYAWSSYTTADGMDVDWITFVSARSPDDIWVNYERGNMGHFDGESWTSYNFAEEYSYTHLNDVEYDHAGDVWIAANGIHYIHDGEWTSWTTDESLRTSRAGKLAVNDPGNEWAEIDYHLARLNENHWEYCKSPSGEYIGSLSNMISVIEIGDDGAVWCATTDGSIHILDGTGRYEALGMDTLTGIPGIFAKLIDLERKQILAAGGSQIVIYSWGDETAVSDSSPRQHTASLPPNSPNPFNPATVIPFTLAVEGHVRLEVFDSTGRFVTELLDTDLPAGAHQVKWNAGEAASGVYFSRLTVGNTILTRKMMLIR